MINFYCNEIGLVIGINGNSHNHSFLYDAKRQGELETYGVKFLRFSNDEVKNNMFSVLLVIEEMVKELTTEIE